MFNKTFVDDGIWTADLWFKKWPLFQLNHNHCPTVSFFAKKN